MKKRNRPRRLELNREHVRRLTADELHALTGGTEDIISFRYCFSRDIPCWPLAL